MDQLKNLANQAKGMSGNTSGSTSANKAGGEDYGDKGLDYVEKQTGHSQSRSTNEKITDKGRELYEKATGDKVNSKFSN